MAIKGPPKVSIGLAVYNGEKYLKDAIESILNQSYTDFELIISDNASTDKTESICRAYAEKDPRIRYSRNLTNIGGANNENLTFKLSKGEYFRLAAHDDMCAPELLSRFVEVLDHEPSIVLVYSKVMMIDELGNSLGILDIAQGHYDTPSARFSDLTRMETGCSSIYGLIRSDVLRKTDLELNYTDSDRSLLCQISLMGKFKRLDEILFYKRYHPDMSVQVYKEWRQRMNWFGAEFKTRITLPHWMQFLHLLRIIYRSEISMSEKIQCFGYMVFWIFQYRRWRSLIKDIVLAAIHSTRTFFLSKTSKKIENSLLKE